MTSIFFIHCLLISVLSVAFGLFVAVNRKKAEQMASVYTWIAFCFVVAMWSLGLGMMTSALNESSANAWLMVHQTGAILIPTILLQFAFSLSPVRESGPRRGLVVRLGIITISHLFTALLLVATYSGKLVYPSPSGQLNFYTSAGPYYDFYAAYFFFCVLYAHAIFVKEFVVSRGNRRIQMKYLLIGSGIGFLGGCTTFLPIYGFRLFPYGVFLVPIYIFLVGFAILRYEFMDLKVLARDVGALLLLYFLVFAIIGLFLSLIHSRLPIPYQTSKTWILLEVGVASFLLSIIPIIFAYTTKRHYWLHGNVTTGLTHELKSPLNNIQNAAEMLEEKMKRVASTGQEGLDYVAMIMGNTQRLRRFVEDLLAVSAIQDGQICVDKKSTNLQMLISHVITSYRSLAEKKGLQLQFDPRVNIHLQADPEKLEQILSNVISNAIKFSDQGTIAIDVEEHNKEIYFTVTDSGRGLRPEETDQIFDRFYQGRNPGKGSGIGLTIAKAWVEAHCGKIWAESEGEGKGTKVTFTLPLS